jgi:aromatic ring-opening dioxygenase catalytic subunit (LigB family)
MPGLYIPHGGGPCFFMDPPPQDPHVWDGMGTYLRGIAASLPATPRAILVVSAHWECSVPTVNTGARPGMLFDYYGFPDHTYQLDYPAPGAPALGAQVRALLAGAGIDSAEDAARGYDHGVFVPFLLMFPDAEIPVLQLSLQAGLDPAAHLAIGRALAPLRDEGVLIVGSGMSYHNLRAFYPRDERAIAASLAFDAALTTSLADADPAVRESALADWRQLPDAIACHPREEHLLPLMVVAGAAGEDAGRRAFNDRVFGKAVSGFHFG